MRLFDFNRGSVRRMVLEGDLVREIFGSIFGSHARPSDHRVANVRLLAP